MTTSTQENAPLPGRIHSIESFGTVDGPGVRFVVFMQGCPMRCAYCHNPDTWEINAGSSLCAAQIMESYERNKSFYKDGGITVTGGEPLLQVDFLIELFTLAKKDNIHTCIDTSGIPFAPSNKEWMKKLDILLEMTDLVMLDIKHIDPKRHKELTGCPNDNILRFAWYLDKKKVPLWIRHVVVPTVTDDESYLYRLGWFIGGLGSLKALDVLPYHTMGTAKYKKLGIPYRLEGIPPMDRPTLLLKKQSILKGIKDRRNQKPAPQ